MDDARLRCTLALQRPDIYTEPTACLQLDGELTRGTACELVARLAESHARPRVLDARWLRYADSAALATLADWIRHVGGRLRIINAPRRLAELAARYSFDEELVITTAPSELFRTADVAA